MILNINKPAGMTSHDVVDAVRKITKERRVGHAGTLDPFASGVLVVAVGRENTKKLERITKYTKKEYEAVLELGTTSTTGDPEGVLEKTESKKRVTEADVRNTLPQFVGEIDQIPPLFSAVKIKGVPAYKLARKGEKTLMPKRRVTIYEIEVLEFLPPRLKLKILCGPGTYIRSLAQDLGEALGPGAYLKELVRTRVGDYTIAESKTLDQLHKP